MVFLAITVDVDLPRLNRNLAISGIGGEIYIPAGSSRVGAGNLPLLLLDASLKPGILDTCHSLGLLPDRYQACPRSASGVRRLGEIVSQLVLYCWNIYSLQIRQMYRSPVVPPS